MPNILDVPKGPARNLKMFETAAHEITLYEQVEKEHYNKGGSCDPEYINQIVQHVETCNCTIDEAWRTHKNCKVFRPITDATIEYPPDVEVISIRLLRF